MRIIKRKILLEFVEKHPQARFPLENWFRIVKEGHWDGPATVKKVFGTAVDFVGNHRAIFDIKGNDYRLIAEINYRRRAVYIRFVGTHKEYDRVDAATVKRY